VFITILEIAGMTREQYDEVGAALAGRPVAEEVVYHSCGPLPDGWRVVEIWQEEAAWSRFIDEEYLPRVRELTGLRASRREATPAHHAGAVNR
jgi:hypothetical protein